MGSPIVFQTAPPHPASNARITCSPQLAGGPEASQKGLGQRMPAKLVVRSAITLLHYCQRGALAIGNRVHHFAAPVAAVAAGVIFRIAGAAGRAVNYDASALDLDRAAQHSDQPRLSESRDDHITRKLIFAAGNRLRAAAAAR